MDWPTISKPPPASGPISNLADYDAACASFRWSDATAQLGLCLDDNSPVNIAEVAVEAHLKVGLGGRTAVRWLAKTGTTTSLTYEELASQSRRFRLNTSTLRWRSSVKTVVGSPLPRRVNRSENSGKSVRINDRWTTGLPFRNWLRGNTSIRPTR